MYGSRLVTTLLDEYKKTKQKDRRFALKALVFVAVAT